MAETLNITTVFRGDYTLTPRRGHMPGHQANALLPPAVHHHMIKITVTKFKPINVILYWLDPVSNTGAPALGFHIQNFPKIATFSFILSPRVASPPVTFSITASPILHIRT